jgi:hypothetical protein
LRLTIAPEAPRDEDLAQQLVADVTEPQHGVLIAGEVAVEVPRGALVHDVLFESGWRADEPWTPLRREFTGLVKGPDMRIEVIGQKQAQVRTAVQPASFDRSTFTVERWHAMAAGLPYADAGCLVAYDDQSNAVAAVTVWSAGAGKARAARADGRAPGSIAVMATAARSLSLRPSHSRRWALQALSSATPSSNVSAVATYTSAGFQQLPEVRDLHRHA